METLFPLPNPVKRQHRNSQLHGQEAKCKACRGSKDSYCFRFDLCLRFEDGDAIMESNDQPIQCDGKDWAWKIDSSKSPHTLFSI